MSHVSTADNVKLHVEERGAGTSVVFVHEFGGSCRSFDSQVEAFCGAHRCIVFNARGYPPSEVPASVDSYSQDIAAGDIGAVLDGLNIARAHLVGVSMGAASALQFALRFPSRVLSATLAGICSGSDGAPGEFQAATEANARLIETQGMAAFAEHLSKSPNRQRLKQKDPVEFDRFITNLLAMSPVGAANTMRGVQQRRPPIYAHEKRLAALALPVLVVVGEEDAGCRKPSEFLLRALPNARLEILPPTGHVVNQEEPASSARLCRSFIDGVDAAAG